MKLMRLSPLLLLAMVACAINEGVGEADRWKPFPGHWLTRRAVT